MRSIADGLRQFSHLLVADTLLHFRLANPTHAMHQFFETYFVLQEPTYSSIYAIGQGLVLAIGRLFLAIRGRVWRYRSRHFVLSAIGCYAPGPRPRGRLWADVLAAIQFGPLNQWMNGYWGGAVSATAGCLVFGALPRLREGVRTREALLLGLGLCSAVTDSALRIHSAGPVRTFVFSTGAAALG